MITHRVAVRDVADATASDDEAYRVVSMQLARWAEFRPDDPAPTPGQLMARLRAGDPHGTVSGRALADLGGRTVGHVTWDISQIDNPQSASISPFVLPAFRRKGIGAALLRHVLEEVARRGASDVTFGFDETAAIGRELRALVEDRWGVSPAYAERVARLDVRALDRAEIERSYADRLSRAAPRYGIFFFEMDDLPGPETGFDLDDYVSMVERIWNLMPREGLKLSDEVYSRASFVRLVERERARNRRIWNYVAIDGESHRSVGVTNIAFDPADPRLIDQWDTGVLTEHQARGLGKLLKLAMLRRVIDSLPRAWFVDTENAGSNEAMIAVNTALGFREHRRLRFYQMPVEALRARIKASTARRARET